MDSRTIEQLISGALPGAQVSVYSDDNVHFHARVVSESFRGASRVERHRRVHKAFGPELGREIHALSLELRTPEEVSPEDVPKGPGTD